MPEALPLPKHIAIIMDGNGRWAQQRGLPRTEGHEAGAESVRVITQECAKLGIEQLTLYAFSAENWKRPSREVNFLMRLLKRYLVEERDEINQNNIRFTTIGNTEKLPGGVRKEMAATKELSRPNTGTILCLALNYGGRDEIVRAVRRAARDAVEGRVKPGRITEESFSQYLDTAGMRDPDLLVRTAGELRVSNFLLWQISYAELYVTPWCWPDFRKEQLLEAIRAYGERERKFGGLGN